MDDKAFYSECVKPLLLSLGAIPCPIMVPARGRTELLPERVAEARAVRVSAAGGDFLYPEGSVIQKGGSACETELTQGSAEWPPHFTPKKMFKPAGAEACAGGHAIRGQGVAAVGSHGLDGGLNPGIPRQGVCPGRPFLGPSACVCFVEAGPRWQGAPPMRLLSSGVPSRYYIGNIKLSSDFYLFLRNFASRVFDSGALWKCEAQWVLPGGWD